jgi:hypothetical protein
MNLILSASVNLSLGFLSPPPPPQSFIPLPRFINSLLLCTNPLGFRRLRTRLSFHCLSPAESRKTKQHRFGFEFVYPAPLSAENEENSLWEMKQSWWFGGPTVVSLVHIKDTGPYLEVTNAVLGQVSGLAWIQSFQGACVTRQKSPFLIWIGSYRSQLEPQKNALLWSWLIVHVTEVKTNLRKITSLCQKFVKASLF